MGVYAQAAGCLPYGRRSLWLALPRGGEKPHRGFFRSALRLPTTKCHKNSHPQGVAVFMELVMGVYTQAAGCLPYGRHSLWLALPGGGKKPHRGFFSPPSDSLPYKFQKGNHP